MRRVLVVIAMAGVLGACAQKSAYEASVEEMEPVYCYKSLAGVNCYKEPYHRDGRRLVNYFGPAPERYDAPEPVEVPELSAPKSVNYWVKDAEPIPRAAPTGDLADRPWLDKKAPPAQVADQPSAGGKEAGLASFLASIMKPSKETTAR